MCWQEGDHLGSSTELDSVPEGPRPLPCRAPLHSLSCSNTREVLAKKKRTPAILPDRGIKTVLFFFYVGAQGLQ